MLKRSYPIARILLIALCLAMAMLTGCGKQHVPPTPYQSGQIKAGTGEAIAATAKTQLGRPYVYGGNSPSKGFDCSGLVYWACANNGITVPRISSEQARVGDRVNRNDLRPGDIVVFKIPRSGYHTGIYIGQDKFIHSPKPRTKVRIESLSVSYWKKNFLTARRVARR